MGRPSSFTDELASTICERLIAGESLVDICDGDDMPSRVTVYRWMEAHPDFETRCARARDGQADYMDALILRTANASTKQTAEADRVKIAAYQWRASKLAPKRYGDKIAHVGGDDTDPAIKHSITVEFVKAKDNG